MIAARARLLLTVCVGTADAQQTSLGQDVPPPPGQNRQICTRSPAVTGLAIIRPESAARM
jgi:hypothetical protein